METRVLGDAIRIVAGAFGLTARDFFIATVDDWRPIAYSELAFGAVVGIGSCFTRSDAQSGVLLACLGGIGSATAFIFLIGWNGFFHLWYLNLGILLIAVPSGCDQVVGSRLVHRTLYNHVLYGSDTTCGSGRSVGRPNYSDIEYNGLPILTRVTDGDVLVFPCKRTNQIGATTAQYHPVISQIFCVRAMA